MRCPKCGYISFDHLEACLKCKKNISAASDALQGGVLHVASPVFLNLQSQEDLSEEFDMVDEAEVVDGDLDILVEEESTDGGEEEIVFGVDTDEEEESDSSDFDISMDEEESELAIDPGFFDDDFGIKAEGDGSQSDTLAEEGEDDFEIEMPEELMDMSDLAPPVPLEEEESSLDIDLESLEFDLDSEVPDEVDSELPAGGINFSEAAGESGEKKSKKSKAMDMDEDLNFDLDLGGLSIHDDI